MSTPATSSTLEKALRATQRWVESVVIELNFCPFAKREVLQQSIRYALTSHTSKAQVLDKLQQELDLLEQDSQIHTTLLILEQGHADFFDYLELLDQAQALIEQQDLSGVYQLASFHPEYLFQGEAANSAANYTNRSPYPMLHLLRESSVEKAVAAYKNPQEIPENNIAKTQQMGLAALQQRLRQCLQD